jgi:beta-lactamase regulating signal transducer with metallopeptidase domain
LGRCFLCKTVVKPSLQEVVVGIGVSLILIAVGAVLAFAVHVTTTGLNINTVGYILLVVGAVGALISLVFWSSWGGVAGSRRTVVEEAPAGRQRTVVHDEVV